MFAEMVFDEVRMDFGVGVFILGLACLASLVAAVVLLIVWAMRRSSRSTHPAVDFEPPRASAGPPDTRITR